MSRIKNPALEAFLEFIQSGGVLAQVLIHRNGNGFELRHAADKETPPETLNPIPPAGAREMAATTASGAFRPLRGAPNLRNGWRIQASNAEELESVLNQVYPGAIVDWFCARQALPPVTGYREFTGRQTGMYRITAMPDDARAGQIIAACCDAKFCLKQRLWSVEGLPADAVDQKSLIPCLEPCAVFLEFARKMVRISQEESLEVKLAPSELESLTESLKAVLALPIESREADVGTALNRRRLQALLQKLEAVPLPQNVAKTGE